MATTGAVTIDGLSAPFFTQIGVDSTTSAADTGIALVAAGNRMLHAVLFHSDCLQLSEHDGTTGYEKSVANLTWSYAGFLSANRSRAPSQPHDPTGTRQSTRSKQTVQLTLLRSNS
ncbi:MAG TPA: hypothetical protein VFP34_12010 [Microlunatus sp.]|nr:hypothetical protein [Microlunatus sp.]